MPNLVMQHAACQDYLNVCSPPNSRLEMGGGTFPLFLVSLAVISCYIVPQRDSRGLPMAVAGIWKII